MGVPLAKMSATTTAFMYANVAPKLHNEMKASLENAMSANVNLSPEVKGFSENYLNFASNAQDHRQYTAIGMGSGSVIVLAMVLTGQIWMVLAAVLGLCFMATFAHQQAMQAKELGDSAILPFPSQTCEVAVCDESTKEFLGRVMTNVLNIKPKDVPMYLNDSSCVGVAEYIGSMVKFQIEYRNVTYYLTSGEEAVGPQKLEGSGGQALPENLKGLTIQDLGESLFDKMSAHAQAWCKSFQTLNKVMNTGMDQLQNCCDMHGSSSQRAQPISEDKTKRVLKLDSLGAAIKAMSPKEAQKVVAEARVFLHNVSRSNPKTALVQELVDKIVKLNAELNPLLSEQAEFKAKEAKLTEGQAMLSTRAKNIQSARAGTEEIVKYLQNELCSVKGKLEQARHDEKRYTYWMFGPFTSTWQNDVQLAKEKVSFFTAKVDNLEKRIASVKDGSDSGVQKLNEDEETNRGAIAKNNAELDTCKEKVDDIEKSIAHKKEDIQEREQEIKSKLQDEGYASVQHLLRANLALNNFAQCAQAASSVQDTTSADWTEHIDEFRILADYLVEAESFKEQKDLAWRLRKIINTPKVPMLQFLKDANAPRTLVPGPNKTFGLGGESPQSQLPQTRKQPQQPMLTD